MSGEAIAAIISAGGSFIATFTGVVLVQRRRSRRDKDVSMVSNFQELFKEMRTDIGRLRDEQRDERRQWADERAQFNLKIESFQKAQREQDTQLHEKDIKIAELTGKVNTLTAQLDAYRESRLGKEPVTI